MRYWYVLALVLVLSLGCAADKGQWDEFWKDVRGDNMQMRYEGWGKDETANRPAPTSSRD